MKAFILAALLVAAPTFAQVPGEDRVEYLVSQNGDVYYIPETHDVVIQPKGGWNTAPFSWLENPLGAQKGRWPFLDALCVHFENQYSTGEQIGETPAVCFEDNRVTR